MKSILILSTSTLALLCCGAAQAQSVPSPSSGASNGGVEEVVVTAERRTEDLQKTSISATVLSGQDLTAKGVNVVDQLQFIAPDVTIDNFGQGVDFDIRGIGKGEHNSQTTPGVITYRDGVATFPGYMTEEPYYDISSIEVLRGTQGTFAGQNAIGGAVFVNTNNPVIDGGYTGYLQGQYGNYNDVALQGAVNLPVDDTFAMRVAFYGESRDSFYTIKTGPNFSGSDGDLDWGAGRLSMLWKPNSHLSVLFKTDIDYLDNGAYPADPYTDRFKFIPGTTTPNPFYAPDLYHIRANADQLAEDEFIRSSLKVDYTFADGITLQSITAYQKGNTRYKADLYGDVNPGGPPTPLNPYPGLISNDTYYFVDNVDETIWSQEVNLISRDTGFFTWIVGAFAQSDDYDFLPPQSRNFVIGQTPSPPGAGLYTLQGTNPETDLSGFGQASFNLPAGFQLQVGGRYSATSTKNNVEVDQYGLPLSDSQKSTANNFSYKVALNWNVDDNNFLYAFVATGFKPGGLNVPVGLGIPAPFRPETVTDYEAGWKSTFFDGHVRTQIDGFYDDFSDFQVIVGYPAFPVFGFELNDPNTTKIYGGEGELQAVFGALSFDAGIGVMHSSLGTFYATDPRVVSLLPCDQKVGPSSVSCVNLAGHEQTYAPNFSFNVGAQYVFNLGEGNTLTPRINYGHVGPQWATLFENAALGDRLAQRNILGAQLEWGHESWLVTLYGTNLTNDKYVAALNSNLDFAGAPRQFGIRVTKAF
jgi:iron complex outermembrane receptor protein